VQPPVGIEDPIAAVFDLSDRAAQMAPTMRRMYRYTATVVVIYLIIMVVLLLTALAHDLVLALLAIIALAFGIIALSLLRETDRFYRSFAQRQRAIRLFRAADPVPKIPEGRTPIERLVRYLRQTNPAIEERLREDPSALRLRTELDVGGRRAPFDLVLVRPGSAGYRAVGLGEAGFSILARMAPEPLTLANLQAFGEEVGAAAGRLDGLPVRAILLRAQASPLTDGVYDFAIGHPIPVERGWTKGRCTLEIVTENADGTYDFVPYVLGIP
jgi:hypothetical protein